MPNAQGYGLGNFVRSYMEAKSRSDNLELERQRLELSKRNQAAHEAEQGLIYDYVGAKNWKPKQTDTELAPKDSSGLINEPQKSPGLVPQNSVADVAARSPSGLLSQDAQVPHQGMGGLAESQEQENINPQPYVTPRAAPQKVSQSASEPVVPQEEAHSQGLLTPSVQRKPQAEEMNPYVGDFRMAPWKMKQIQAQEQSQQHILDMQNPDSDVSKRTTAFAKNLYNEQNPGRGDKLFEGDLSVQDIHEMLPMLQKVDETQARKLNAALQGLKTQAMIDRYASQEQKALADQAFRQGPQFDETKRHNVGMEKANMARAGAMQEGVNVRKQQFNAKAQTDILNDPTIKKYSDLLTQIDSDKALLLSGKMTPGQVAKEIGNNLAAVIQRSRTTAVADRDAQGWPSAYGTLGSFKQWLTGQQQNYLTPNFKFALSDQLDRLKGNLNASRGFLAISKRAQYQNPDVQSVHDSAIKSMAPDWAPGVPASQWMSGKIKSNSQSVGPHGSTVIQNGIRYNWNPGSGKYE